MIKIQFTDSDWQRMQQNTMAWWAGELARPLVYLAITNPIPPEKYTMPLYNFWSNYPLTMPAEKILDQFDLQITNTRFYADAFPWWWVNFGPGIAAGFLGAVVNSVTEPSETVWFTPSTSVTLSELNLQYDPQNIWWRRVKEITAALVQRYGNTLSVSHTDLGGNLDLLASFRGTEELLMDMIECPEDVEKAAAQLTRLWIQYYNELDCIIRPACRGTSCWTPIWSTGKTYMLQSDFAYMISPAMFERFVVPDLTACCQVLDHGFYHLDGKNQIPHLDHLLSIERLRGIQWIPGDGQPPPHEWLPLLKRIRDGGKLCQVFVSPEGARTIVKNLGGKGFYLVIQPSPSHGFTDPQRVHAFLDTLAKEDISQ